MQREERHFETYLITSQNPRQRSLSISLRLSKKVRTIGRVLFPEQIFFFGLLKDDDLPQERLMKLYKRILRARDGAACELIDQVCSTQTKYANICLVILVLR